ncbi:MAG: Wadjet anti-phage system protein JetD domain-containing protein [Gammaproteobacteria bacterium]
MSAPRWLADEAWLRELLHWFLDALDKPRTRPVTRRVTREKMPAMFQFDIDTGYRWQLIEQLASEHLILAIEYDRKRRAFEERYENALLRLNPDREGLLREWLERPREDPVLAAWHAAIAAHGMSFADGGAALLASRPSMAGHAPADIVAAFAAIGPLLDDGLSLRELSARCFHGHSKFLDQRADLLHSLFGARAAAIAPRPLLLAAFAPPAFEQLLIIENQDSFLRLVAAPPPACALLYSGGFRASAGRLASGHTRFAFMPGSDAEAFHARWLDANLPAYFWGDLDFTGLGILKALRAILPRLQAWQPGYSALLERLLDGAGHSPAAAGKEGQNDPGYTGCAYADNTLLPALRATDRFVDQEAVRP